jgi:ribosomal protein L37E
MGKKSHPKCSRCGRRSMLTKEGVCATCYKEKFGKWAKEFTDYPKNAKDNE